MRMNEIDFESSPPIDSYGPGFFRVDGKVLEGNLLMLPSGPETWSGWSDLQAVLARAGDIDVIFLGMGADIGHPPAEVADALRKAEIAFEVMSTSAACRTYNVLLSEGRRVAAALLAV